MVSESDEEFVIRQLALSRRRDDIISGLCERSGLSWNEADLFINLVNNENQGRIRRPFNMIFFGALVITGIALMLAAMVITHMTKAIASHDWPFVGGTIVSSDLRTGYEDTPYARVTYTYQLDEKSYDSQRIRLGLNCFASFQGVPSECTRKDLRKYPAGGHVNVYHDPSNSEFSVLEPGVSPTNVALLVILTLVAIILIVIGLQGIIRNPVY